MTEGRPCTDTGRREPCIKPRKEASRKTNLPIPWSQVPKIVRKYVCAVSTIQSVVLCYGSPSKLKCTLFTLFHTPSNCPATLCRAPEGWHPFWSSQPAQYGHWAQVTIRQATEFSRQWRLLPFRDYRLRTRPFMLLITELINRIFLVRTKYN